MKKTHDGKGPIGVTPVPDIRELTEQRGRDAVNMTPIPVHQPSLAPANAEPIVVGDVHGGRDPLNMTPLPSNPLEKGRGGAPMVPVPTQAPKSGEGTPGSDKKK